LSLTQILAKKTVFVQALNMLVEPLYTTEPVKP